MVVKNMENKREVLEWLDTHINELQKFRDYIEDGRFTVTGGYFEDHHSMPTIEERTEKTIVMSIDYVGE